MIFSEKYRQDGERMKKVKKRYRVLLLVSVCVLAFMNGVLAGYFGKNEKNEKSEDEKGIKAVAVEEETLSEKQEAMYYTVAIRGDEILLLEVFSDMSERVVEKANVNTSWIPTGEVELLRAGLKFDTKEDALMLVENFVS